MNVIGLLEMAINRAEAQGFEVQRLLVPRDVYVAFLELLVPKWLAHEGMTGVVYCGRPLVLDHAVPPGDVWLLVSTRMPVKRAQSPSEPSGG